MTTPSHTQPERLTVRVRITRMLGNLLILLGAFLLLYAGGSYVQIEYNRMAARGDNNLPAPQRMVDIVPRIHLPQLYQPAPTQREPVPAAFTVPVLGSGNDIVGPPPEAAEQPFVSTIERIVIPRINVDSKVIEVGWDIETRENGDQVAVWQVAEYAVGHHHGSANPGEGDNVVLAGHVGGYGKVFRELYSVEPGDTIIVYSAGQQYLYVVQEHLVLDEENVPLAQRIANARYIQPTALEAVTLVTCWPENWPEPLHPAYYCASAALRHCRGDRPRQC
ncbi:MAG: sortase [Chloroflexaceae bacterium]|nr:sortase [Chloroflexaceae bacterium]